MVQLSIRCHRVDWALTLFHRPDINDSVAKRLQEPDADRQWSSN